MTEIRPVDLPEKDLPLRADVSLLGSLVGQMLVEQHGPRLLQLVETIRKAAILRREPGSADSAGLDQVLAGLRPVEVRQVIIRRYVPEVRRLGRYLSQTTSEIAVSPDITRRLGEYARSMPDAGHSIPQRHRTCPTVACCSG